MVIINTRLMTDRPLTKQTLPSSPGLSFRRTPVGWTRGSGVCPRLWYLRTSLRRSGWVTRGPGPGVTPSRPRFPRDRTNSSVGTLTGGRNGFWSSRPPLGPYHPEFSVVTTDPKFILKEDSFIKTKNLPPPWGLGTFVE